MQADVDASYEIEVEGETGAEYDDSATVEVQVDATAADAPKDNGEVTSNGLLWNFIVVLLFVFNFRRFSVPATPLHVTTLGKLFTHMCLCSQAV